MDKESKRNKKEEKREEKHRLSCYTNRELSWLQFNVRVLREAENEHVPLAERLSFVSIYQSNLDEFFMVRVGTLMDQMHAGEKIRDNKTNMTSKQQVEAILERTRELEALKTKIYEQLMGELEPQNVHLINFNRLSKKEIAMLETYFDQNIAPFLMPMLIGKQQPFPFLNNKELYALMLLTTKGGKSKLGLVPCTNSAFKRLIEIPSRPGTFMLCEDLILQFTSKLFPTYSVKEKFILRVTRNADIDGIEVYDEDLDYRGVMEQLIKQRTRLSPVRVELSHDINKKTCKELAKHLGINMKHVIRVDTPLDLSFVFQLQHYLRDRSELFYEKRSPCDSPALNMKESVLDQIGKKDVLLSYPYESMKPFLRMLHEAAEDESVISIRMTLYRVADQSKIIDALVEAAENGREVIVMVELRARFDEANNIEISRRLEEAGCHIIYGLGKYKVHCKLCQIVRKREDGFQYITQIGTGNYNEKTARLYTDLSLLTANRDIGTDVDKVFRSLLMGETVSHIEHLMVAPHCLQNKVLALIEDEIEKAKHGRPSYIGVKLNSLTDKDIIEKLIDASEAGVKIELIIRGICCLVPAVPELTENITVISVVGRFLEHSRIYRFGVGEEEKVYISSADFMTRNTLRRVEVAVPIYDLAIKKQICHIFDTVLADDAKGKMQTRNREYIDRMLGEKKLDAQEVLYEEAYRAINREEPEKEEETE